MRTSVRRPTLAAIAVCAGVALGAVTVAGLTSTVPLSGAAAASVNTVFSVTMPMPAASPASLSAPLQAVVQDASDALDDARTARAKGTVVTADIAASALDVGVDTSIDTGRLDRAIARLENIDVIPVLMLPALTEEASQATDAAVFRVTVLRTTLDAALMKQSAERAAAESQRQAEAAAAAAAEAAAQAAAAQALANTVAGAQATAQRLAAERYGWGGDQFSCLVSLWNKESSWNYQAYNASSGATGIPQSLPGDKMASAGADWQTNAATQIAWGLDYIDRAYGSPCAAWGHSSATNWY